MIGQKIPQNRRLSKRCIGPSLWIFTCFACLFFGLGFSEGVLSATTESNQTTDEPTEQTEKQTPLNLSDILQTDFVYQRGNRPDPFVPFISVQTTTGQIEPAELLTGMRLFEPGQLNLVAITTGGDTNFALVQDSTGKGYLLKEGIAIGRKGVIKSIMPNSILIEEKFVSSSGQQRIRPIKMVLRKEGEK